MSGRLRNRFIVPPAFRRRQWERRGSIFVVATWVILVLVGLVVVLGQSMRVEAVTSANELSTLQAETVEQGAIAYVQAHVESLGGAMPLDSDMPCECVQVGDGAFWIVRTNSDTTNSDSRTWMFGVEDEAAKINVNTADQPTLALLPGMTDEFAACIIDWRDSDETPTPGGVESQYYLLLSEPYKCKNAPLETVDELFLVNGATNDILFGEDANRNGVLDANENDADAREPADNKDGRLERGIYPFVTVYSVEANKTADGQNRVNINDARNPGLINLLRQNLSQQRFLAVLPKVGPGRPFKNAIDLYYKLGLTQDEFAPIADRLTTTNDATRSGLVNVNTAPREVLMCLPGMTESDAEALITGRAGTGVDLSSIAWIIPVLKQDAAVAIGGLITTQTYRFSADIVSVSGDGRAFRRCRVVVDAQATPPKVLYRQDLTRLGWPLDPEILKRLRSGTPIESLAPTTTTTTTTTQQEATH